MTRKELQQLADKRLSEAQSLFRAKFYEGSYHLAGIAVECAIKACIARQTKKFEFPDKAKALKSYDHNLVDLIKVAGLQPDLDQEILKTPFAASWRVVTSWRIESRYTVKTTRQDAHELLQSITNPANGVMAWLRIHW